MASSSDNPDQPNFDINSKSLEEIWCFNIGSFMLQLEYREKIITEFIEACKIEELYEMMEKLVELFHVDPPTGKAREALKTFLEKHPHLAKVLVRVSSKAVTGSGTGTEQKAELTKWDVIDSVCQCFFALLLKEDKRSPKTVDLLQTSIKELIKKSGAEQIKELWAGYQDVNARMDEFYMTGKGILGRNLYGSKLSVGWQQMFTSKTLNKDSLIIIHQVMCLQLAMNMVFWSQRNPPSVSDALVGATAGPFDPLHDMTALNSKEYVGYNFMGLVCNFMLDYAQRADAINLNWGMVQKIEAYYKEKMEIFKDVLAGLGTKTRTEIISAFQGFLQVFLILILSWNVKDIASKLKELFKLGMENVFKNAIWDFKKQCPSAWEQFFKEGGDFKIKFVQLLNPGHHEEAMKLLIEQANIIAETWIAAKGDTATEQQFYVALLWQCFLPLLLILLFCIINGTSTEEKMKIEGIISFLFTAIRENDGSISYFDTGDWKAI